MLAIMVTSQETGQQLFNSSTDLDTTPANLSLSSHEPSNCFRLTIKLGSDCLGGGGASEDEDINDAGGRKKSSPVKELYFPFAILDMLIASFFGSIGQEIIGQFNQRYIEWHVANSTCT